MGQTIKCPHCGEKTIPQRQLDAEAWPKAATRMVCMFCGGELQLPEESGTEKKALRNSSAPSNALTSLLGLSDADLERNQLFENETIGHFCRTCRYYVLHPFQSRCALSDLPADPMADCEHYRKREENPAPDQSSKEEEKHDSL